jgi:hypothetical protein
LREFLARAVRKATGAHNAAQVTPNHRPVFPPMPPEAASASLEAQGDVIFRTAPATTPGTPAAISSSPQRRRGDAGVTNVGLNMAGVAPFDAQQHPADEHPEPSEVLNRTTQDQIAGRHAAHVAVQNAIAAVVRAMDAPPRDSRSQQTSSEEMAAAALLNQDSPNDGITVDESALRQVISQKIVPSTAQELHEPAEVRQLAPRQNSFREPSGAAAEETAVQVRIGRIEVRVAAPVSAPAPPAAKRQGPRGFAEYEAVRRYMTRSRM